MKRHDERRPLQTVIARARAAWAAKLAAGGTAVAVAVAAVAFGVGALVIGVTADVGISHGWFKSQQAESAAAARHHEDTQSRPSRNGKSGSHRKDTGKNHQSQKTQVGREAGSEADNVIDYDDLFGSSPGDDGQMDDSSGTSVQQGNGDESSQGGDWTNSYK